MGLCGLGFRVCAVLVGFRFAVWGMGSFPKQDAQNLGSCQVEMAPDSSGIRRSQGSGFRELGIRV